MNWIKDANDWALDCFEIILDAYQTSRYIEYIGQIGGDTLTYRYYIDGRIAAR